MPFESFKQDGRPPPPHYRTPSPPHRDIELISPHALEGANVWTGHKYAAGNTFPTRRRGHTRDVRDTRGCSREGAPPNKMDAFASIALATKPSQSSYIPRPCRQGLHQMPTYEKRQSERPHKRAKSEKVPSPDVRREITRPVTGYVQPNEDRTLDAELLLHFSRSTYLAVPPRPQCYQEPDTVSRSIAPALDQLQTNINRPPIPSCPPTWYQAALLNQEKQDAHNAVEQQSTVKRPTNDLSKVVLLGSHAEAVMEATPSEVANEAFTVRGCDSHVLEPYESEFDLSTSNEHVRPARSATHPISMDTYQAQVHNIVDSGSQAEIIMASPARFYHCSGNPEKFLDGIEEAAREATTDLIQKPSILPAQEETTETIFEASPENLIPKRQSVNVPSVCAACNFARNSLTLETENNATSWISCDGCKDWFHFACAGFKTEREVRDVDKYRCRKCKPILGPTTLVRKSARPHSAIDYAGLNEGVLKTSDENPEHHYIKPIKEGIIKFNPETFARMRPELVTAEYFEKGDGMKEPIVIPAAWNPRPRAIPRGIPGNTVKDGVDSTEADLSTDDLHDQSVLDQWLSHEFEYQTVPDHGQDALDMVIPQDLTVRKVAELYGPEEKVEVIDVKSQNGEDKKWNMRRWADYYESQDNKIVRNVISLEVSQSQLGRLIRRPKIVRDLDLQDSVWPTDLLAKGDYPKVQFYCLMSVADCFTDFHIDFGGSSVFYHILKGKKTFFFIPPHEKHLKKYEEWCMSPAQNWTFLGDQTKECYRVDLSEGDTMLIPAGWIHAVWTPEDSLVIGGNFLTRMHYPMQIRVAQIEKATGVARKFRYPHFQKLLWYTALRYLEEDPIPESVVESLLAGQSFYREQPTYLDFDSWGESSVPGPENYHARYYSKHELEGLPELARYLQRTALIAMGNITDGISVETRNAVKRSIPKGHGEPLDVVKKFAIWYTWKNGNEPIPHWAYPDHVPEGRAPELTEKKLSKAALRKLDREAARQAWRVAPDRQSTRRRSQPHVLTEISNLTGDAQSASKKTDSTGSSTPLIQQAGPLKRKFDASGSDAQTLGSHPIPAKRPRPLQKVHTTINRRPACESCRKRRRACKHREDVSSLSNGSTPQGQTDRLVIINSNPQVQVPRSDARTLSEGSSSGTSSTALLDAKILSESCSGPDLQLVTSLQDSIANKPPENLEGIQPSPNQPKGKATTLPSSPTKPTESLIVPTLSFNTNSPIKSPGRSKACQDCRKSKRRCVHDERGNEDPIKVAEAAIPRPAAVKKRKISGESPDNGSSKKVKKAHRSQTVDDPFAQGPANLAIQVPAPLASMAGLDPKSNMHTVEDSSQIAAQFLEQVRKPESGIHNDTITLHTPAKLLARAAQTVILPPTFSPEDEVNLIATSPLSELKFEPEFESNLLSSVQNFAQQPASSLVSPPASAHTDTDQTPPASSEPNNMTPSATASSSRQSSRPAKTVQRYTPESGSARRESTVSHGRASGSPTISAGVVSGPGSSAQKRTKSRVGSEIEADEESMRLIRELQAQDMGLRRRGRV